MKLRNTLILLAVAVGLVLFIVIFEKSTKTTGEILDLRKRAFPEIKDRTDDATAIEIERGPEKVVLVKRDAGTDDEHWRITQPIDYKADTMRVRGFLGAFRDAEKAVVDAEGSTEIPLAPADPVTEYKLDDESAVRVKVSAGKELILDALVGGLTASKDKVYVARAQPREAVYVVGDAVNDEARRVIDEFRDKRLLTLKSKGHVTGLTVIEDEKPKAVLSREKGKRWHLVSPVADRASKEKADAIVDRMDSLWADTFVADFGPDDPDMPKRMAEYGLVPPMKSVKISLDAGGEVRQHEILFGKRIKKTETGSSTSWDVYAMVGGSRTVALVPASNLDPLDVTVDDLRDKAVVDFDTSDVLAVAVDRFPGEIRLEKKDDNWRMLVPDEHDADKTSVDGLLDALRDLRIEKFLPAGTELKTPIRVEVTCKAEENDAAVVEPGDGPEDKPEERETELAFFERGEGDTIRARRGEKGAVFEVPRSILEKLISPALHFRDRRVLEFETGKLDKLTVTIGGRTDTAVREDGEWKLEGEGEVDGLRVDRIKWDISELEAEEFVGKATDAELKKQGLDPAAVRVEATLEPETDGRPALTHVLLVGAVQDPQAKDGEKKYFARLGDDPMVFLLNADDLKDVMMGLVKKSVEEDAASKDAGGGAKAEDKGTPSEGAPEGGGQ